MRRIMLFGSPERESASPEQQCEATPLGSVNTCRGRVRAVGALSDWRLRDGMALQGEFVSLEIHGREVPRDKKT